MPSTPAREALRWSGGYGAIMIEMRMNPRMRRLALDWLVPLVILVIGIANVTRHPHSTQYPGSPAGHLVFIVVAVAALGVRRWARLAAPLAATVIVVCWSALMWPKDAQGPFEGFLVLVGSAYCIGVLNTGRRLALGAAALVVGFLVGQVIILSTGGRDGDLLPVGVWLAVALGTGILISRRTEQVHEAREAATLLAAEQEQQTLHAIENERARIARELHDVVAHGLSVIVVQAGTERRGLHTAPVDVESIDSVLGSIERAGREALVDLRRLLGLLRRSEDPVALAPQPGLAQLADLVRAVRDAGIDVEVDIVDDRPALPPGLDLTAYRIVQEALTNVLKHANACTVRVGVALCQRHLELDISDDGNSASVRDLPTIRSGHGLIGMRERVNVFGGTLTTGPTPDGGWKVHARLPITQVGGP
jgi:signal transduction histidine kinase